MRILIAAAFAASPALITRYPSIEASSARIGSTSTTTTLAPMPCAREAMPRPTQPYPPTTTDLPAKRMFVARKMPSIADWPVP